MNTTTEMTGVLQLLERIEDHLRCHPFGETEADNAAAIDALVVSRAIIGQLNVIAETRPGELPVTREPAA